MPAVADDLTERVMKLTLTEQKRLMNRLGRDMMKRSNSNHLTVSRAKRKRIVLVEVPELEANFMTDEVAEKKWPGFREWVERARNDEGELVYAGEI